MNTTSAKKVGPQAAPTIISGSSQATLISQSLREVARKARHTPFTWTPTIGVPNRRWQKTLVPVVAIAFVLIFFLPTLISGIYLAFFASQQYASETQFAVRGGGRTLLESLGGGLKAGLAMQTVQDTQIVLNYIQSRDMVEKVDKSLNLRKMYSRDDIDYVWRFDPTASIEKLVIYWNRRVSATVDPTSGIITVIATAFTPQDALNVANAIIADSEKLVNDLTERARNDAMRQAQAELDRAQKNMVAQINALRNLRNTEGTLDPAAAANAVSKMHTQLRLGLIQLEQQYDVQLRSVASTAPQMRVLKARIDAMREQLSKLEAEITSTPASTPSSALSESMSRFNIQSIESRIAQQQYQAAMEACERARLSLTTQDVYLATFLRPVLAEYALYPQRLWLWSIIAVLSFLLWAGGSAAGVIVRNHIAT